MRCRADCPSTASRRFTTKRGALRRVRCLACSRSSWTSSTGNGSSRSGSARVESIKREYDALVKAAGHDWSHPGFHEKDLPGLLKPDFVMPVGPFRETLLADSILEELNGRTYSSQWDVPEEIHRGAVESLRTKWKGKEFQRSYTLEVTFWRSERLPQIAEAQRS